MGQNLITEESFDMNKLTDCFKKISIDMRTNLTTTMISGIYNFIRNFATLNSILI